MATEVSVILQDASNNVILSNTDVSVLSIINEQLVVVEDQKMHIVSLGEQGPPGPIANPTGYTVATLPIGIIGLRAYVTDALNPSYLSTPIGGGLTVCPVFHNGVTWVLA